MYTFFGAGVLEINICLPKIFGWENGETEQNKIPTNATFSGES